MLFHQIFKADIRIRGLVNTSGLVNGMNMRSAVNNSKTVINETVQQLAERWKTIEKNMQYISRVSRTLPSVVVYLETDEELMIPGNNVSKVDVVYLPNTVRLNAHSEQSGKSCDLPDDCPCSYETVIDLTDKNAWRRKPGEIVRNFSDVNLISNTVSSSEKCTSTRIEEFTTILSTKNLTNISKNASNKIEGYLNDAERFTYDGTYTRDILYFSMR